jgi:hypothetical protein
MQGSLNIYAVNFWNKLRFDVSFDEKNFYVYHDRFQRNFDIEKLQCYSKLDFLTKFS